jgi:hypothetical protein
MEIQRKIKILKKTKFKHHNHLIIKVTKKGYSFYRVKIKKYLQNNSWKNNIIFWRIINNLKYIMILKLLTQQIEILWKI